MAPSEEHKQTPTQPVAPTPQEAKAEPSGYTGGNPSTACPGQTAVRSNTPENRLGHLNPSAPEDSNATPGSLTDK